MTVSDGAFELGVDKVLWDSLGVGWLAFNGDELGVAPRRGEGEPGDSGRRKGELRAEGTPREGVLETWSGRALCLWENVSGACHVIVGGAS